MPCHVAVIGAGAAGVVAARELMKEGHKVVVFERNREIGGTWAYQDETESDPSGRDPSRIAVHCSLYKSLRINIPREILGFKDFPFAPTNQSFDSRRFPRHEEVLLYLKEFARSFPLEDALRLQTQVVRVEREGKRWRVKSRRKGFDSLTDELYDAVVVCNGHYAEPRLAQVPGVESWPGKEMHSHNYRTPEPFKDQVVVLIGFSSSGMDLSRELAGFAKEVHAASHEFPDEKFELQSGYDNLWIHSMIEQANEDGTVRFRNGETVDADVIMHCTGYSYSFPFLDKSVVEVKDNRVWPLYKHVFSPEFAPSMSFVGIPSKIAAFFVFELQSKWIAGVLSGRIGLPTREQMMEEIRALSRALESSNVPRRHTHNLENAQFPYTDWLAEQCGCSGSEKWRELMYEECCKKKNVSPDTYRDEWEDHDLVAEAYKDFQKYTHF